MGVTVFFSYCFEGDIFGHLLIVIVIHTICFLLRVSGSVMAVNEFPGICLKLDIFWCSD